MDRWEYCEVRHSEGKVWVRFFVEEGNGWDASEFAERNVNNMAKVLASLGKQGWEVIAIHPSMDGEMPHSYTFAARASIAFLKRRIADTE